MKYLQEELIKSGKSSWTAFTFKNNLLWYVICFNYVVCFITDCFEIIFKNICHPSLLTYSWSHRLLSSLGKPSFWNFEKYPKISKGGTLGIFLLLDFFLKFWKFFQNIQRGDPWDFSIIGIYFEILKKFPKYPKGGPLGFFFWGYPPP